MVQPPFDHEPGSSSPPRASQAEALDFMLIAHDQFLLMDASFIRALKQAFERDYPEWTEFDMNDRMIVVGKYEIAMMDDSLERPLVNGEAFTVGLTYKNDPNRSLEVTIGKRVRGAKRDNFYVMPGFVEQQLHLVIDMVEGLEQAQATGQIPDLDLGTYHSLTPESTT